LSAKVDSAVSKQPVAAASSHQLVLHNAMLLVVAQAVAMPVSVVVNVILARYVGPQEFGYFYLAGTFVAFGFLLVDWGQSGTLPAKVARSHARAGELLGSGLAWRLVAAPLVYGALALACYLLGYSAQLQVALGLVALNATIASAAGACQDVIRGFERTDIAAYTQVGSQLLGAAFVIPALLLGGGLTGALLCYPVAGIVMLLLVVRSLGPVGVGRLLPRRETVFDLVREGWPFLLFAATMALHPNVDALFLSKLTPVEVVGWYAAARKLIGVIVYPAAALVGALYPTLSRLHGEDPEGYRATASRVLVTSTIIVVPLAVGTGLFADVAIAIFNKDAYGPAVWNMRLMAPFILLVYFSMPLGSALLAAGRQRAWALTQLLCVVISCVLNPLLVPYFQRVHGNGGLGVCVAAVASEVFMVGIGMRLARGIFTRQVLRELLLSLVAGGVMAAVALVVRPIGWALAAPLSTAAYVAALWMLGGMDAEQVAAIRQIIQRKRGGTAQ
jgi:O-antigen/teichoic acid export membrane protein